MSTAQEFTVVLDAERAAIVQNALKNASAESASDLIAEALSEWQLTRESESPEFIESMRSAWAEAQTGEEPIDVTLESVKRRAREMFGHAEVTAR